MAALAKANIPSVRRLISSPSSQASVIPSARRVRAGGSRGGSGCREDFQTIAVYNVLGYQFNGAAIHNGNRPVLLIHGDTPPGAALDASDRKSTRLNSRHRV